MFELPWLLYSPHPDAVAFDLALNFWPGLARVTADT